VVTASARELSRAAASAIRRAAVTGEVAISAITLVEAGLLNRGRLRLRDSLESSIQGLIGETKIKAITMDIAVLTAHFPPDFRSDPMDRIIAATARAEGLPLVTADERNPQLSVAENDLVIGRIPPYLPISIRVDLSKSGRDSPSCNCATFNLLPFHRRFTQ